MYWNIMYYDNKKIRTLDVNCNFGHKKIVWISNILTEIKLRLFSKVARKFGRTETMLWNMC